MLFYFLVSWSLVNVPDLLFVSSSFFLLGSCSFRFVLSRQNEAIQPHYVDPDSPIEWDDLEQLCLYSVTDYECLFSILSFFHLNKTTDEKKKKKKGPICLERPVAGFVILDLSAPHICSHSDNV